MATNTFYSNETDAKNDVNGRSHNYIAYLCPFTYGEKACGSWCPLFEIASHTRGLDGAVLTHVNLRCGDGQRVLHAIS